MELITVVVPVYNVEPYLRKCVDSILAQTYTNLEIILIDDGSPDNCGVICDEYAKKDKRVKVIHKANGGVSSARNAGLDAATGEYIAFVDADDFIPLNYLEALRNDMTDDMDMVTCEKNLYLPNGEKFAEHARNIQSTVALDSFAPQNFAEYGHGMAWGVLYRSFIVGDLRFNTNYYVSEDTLFYYSVLRKCRKARHTISTAYCYVKRPGSVMNSPFNEKDYTMIYAWQNILRLYADNVEIREILEADFAFVCHSTLDAMRKANISDANKIKFLKREVRHFLPQSLKRKKYRKSGYIMMNFTLDAFFNEKCILLLKKLYRRLKKRTA